MPRMAGLCVPGHRCFLVFLGAGKYDFKLGSAGELEEIEILDAKRKNLKPALLTDTGFIDTGWCVPFHPAYYLPPPLKFVSQKNSRFLAWKFGQFVTLLILRGAGCRLVSVNCGVGSDC